MLHEAVTLVVVNKFRGDKCPFSPYYFHFREAVHRKRRTISTKAFRMSLRIFRRTDEGAGIEKSDKQKENNL